MIPPTRPAQRAALPVVDSDVPCLFHVRKMFFFVFHSPPRWGCFFDLSASFRLKLSLKRLQSQHSQAVGRAALSQSVVAEFPNPADIVTVVFIRIFTPMFLNRSRLRT